MKYYSSVDHSLYVASLIESYLESHPDATDSFEGIRHWWITEQKIQESKKAVEMALDILVKRGTVEEVGDGIYRYARR